MKAIERPDIPKRATVRMRWPPWKVLRVSEFSPTGFAFQQYRAGVTVAVELIYEE